MVATCCVPNCRSKYSNIGNGRERLVTFHSIPRCEITKTKWLEAIGVNVRSLKKHNKVCSKHFRQSDFSSAKGNKKLKTRDIVPSRFVTNEDNNPEEMRETGDDINDDIMEVTSLQENADGQIIQPSVSEMDYNSSNNIQEDLEVLRLKNHIKYLEAKLEAAHKSNQQYYPHFCIEQVKCNDNKFLYYTGLTSYKIFEILFKFVLPSGDITTVNSIKCKMKKRISKLSPENQLFLCLIKLRKGVDHEMLGDMFGVSTSTVGAIFLTWINLLYVKLGSLNVWPHRNVLIANAPGEFQQNYPNVIGSIDCTEFIIQKPSSMVRQSQCYSNYKSATTLKSLIMVDPNGAIIFNSTMMTGSISDKQIIVDSGFLNTVKRKLEENDLFPGDIIMADKGFNVDALFKEVPLTINIPTFRINGFPFSPQEVQVIRKIAVERIHVERAIGRLKKFKILRNVIPISLLGSINQIHSVSCMLTNFRYVIR